MEVGMNRDLILKSTRDLMERFILRKDKSTFSGQALAHVHRGFIVRVMMIQQAAVDIDVDLGEAKEPLSSHKSIELSLLLNSFYLHLAGSLDNLAWALAYHHNLRQGLDENSPKDQRFVGLFKEAFIDELDRVGYGSLGITLRSLIQWNKDLKTFRDPGAHRIPLSVPRALFTEQDVVEQRQFDAEAATHYSKGDDEKGREAFAKMAKLGDYYPIFISENPKVTIYLAGAKLTEDFTTWYRIADEAFTIGLNLPRI